MLQMARGMLDGQSGVLHGKEYLIVDRLTKYTAAFRAFLAREGVEVLRLPPRSRQFKRIRRKIRQVRQERMHIKADTDWRTHAPPRLA